MTTDDSTIPAIETAHDPILCPDDLRQRWRALMGPLGFGSARLWFAFVGSDHRLVKVLDWLPLPAEPDPADADPLLSTLGVVVAELGADSVALLISRPGRDGVSDDDLAWARLLVEAARRHGVPLQPVHRANDVELVALTNANEAAA
ncbi:hypothetical protein GIY30_22380 [Gordonia sp. HNM0687]|uniref:Uncharacterized protein n=1 Tax=Gordonia mangrovi TaxID=2665643 RepID=A0A6L7GVS4_9ACTN|nr:hypothetical protein [Gordonia mangrovi]MDY6810613.1 hypothetical protein [Actinomycetota bacterium]MXP24089.1 hypothetical protein [Gordonia mangrovi]UVF78108.1 hypothetical protein NWF22_23275 [Gordonia mangrovi]